MGMERREEPKYPSIENWLETLKQLRKFEGTQWEYLSGMKAAFLWRCRLGILHSSV